MFGRLGSTFDDEGIRSVAGGERCHQGVALVIDDEARRVPLPLGATLVDDVGVRKAGEVWPHVVLNLR
jgi:hypothetical protein